MPQFEQAEEFLRSLLVGRFYSVVEVGDTWAFRFEEFWLLAQDISAPEESSLHNLLQLSAPAMLVGVDSEYVPKGILALRYLRQEVTDITLADDAALHLHFQGGNSLVFPATTPVVDWQWAVNPTDNSPYANFLVACFWQGEIQVNSL